MDNLEVPTVGGSVTVPYLTSRLRGVLPEESTIAIEAVTNAITVIHHLQLTKVRRRVRRNLGDLGKVVSVVNHVA